VRKGGGPELWGASIGGVGFAVGAGGKASGFAVLSIASANGHCRSLPIPECERILALPGTDH